VSGQILTSAAITLQRMDAHNTGTLPAPVRAVFDPKGHFEIRDVTAGPYLITAEGADSGQRLIGQTVVTIAEEDLENLDLVIAPDRTWSGVLLIEGGGRLDPKRALLPVLEPRSERGAAARADVRNSNFQFRVMADETYDFYIQNLPDDFYIASVRVNGTDVMGFGLEGSLATQPLEVVLNSRGGRVAGRVAGPDGNIWSGASLILVPDPPRGRIQAYREASADEYGQFQVRGIPPGKYLLLAWLDDPPCDYYDPAGLDACRAVGTSVTVSAAAQENVLLQMKAPIRR